MFDKIKDTADGTIKFGKKIIRKKLLKNIKEN